MYQITIKGFHTKQQAREFASWYNGQGEQDAMVWFECRMEEGVLDVSSMTVDCSKPYDDWDEVNGVGNLNICLNIDKTSGE